jgi:glycosyltransferase involved in cell wall biosynthesis
MGGSNHVARKIHDRHHHVREKAVRVALLALHFAEYASRLALALAARHEVLLVLRPGNARDELSDDLRAQLDRMVTMRSLELPKLRSFRFFSEIRSMNRILRSFSPEILHIQEIHPVYAGWTILSFRKSLPVVLTIHDHLPRSGEISKHGLHWRLRGWLRSKASRMIVHGPRMRAELEELDSRIAGRIEVIPHGILGRSGIDDDISCREPGTFLFFGRIHPYKGLRYLLDAGELLQRRGHAFRLLIAGTGTDLCHHRARMASFPWIELIDRYISAAEVPRLFRRAAAVVLPYTDATQSGVSAMAFGFARPVIATSVGDVPDVVVDGQTGLIVPPRDPVALADAMQKILLDRPLRDTLATGAVRFAGDKLAWPRIAEATDGAYHRAMNSH